MQDILFDLNNYELVFDYHLLRFFERIEVFNNNAELQTLIIFLFGGINAVTNAIFNLIGFESFDAVFGDVGKVIEEIANDDTKKLKRNEKDENLKLFNDYIKDYVDGDKKYLTKSKLYGDMALMLLAATDTTYGALSFAMVLAAKYPSIQQELYKELKDAYGTIENITLQKGGILKMPKLRAFVYECMRIYPPAQAAGFRDISAKEGLEIDTRPYGGDKVYKVPKGTQLMINIMAAHHNAEFWVKDYDPINNEQHKNINMKEIHLEFWLDSQGKFDILKNKVNFLTFSTGKRDCPGQSLAIKELYIVLAMIFMTYKVSGPNGDNQFEIKPKLAQVVEPDPNQIRLELR